MEVQRRTRLIEKAPTVFHRRNHGIIRTFKARKHSSTETPLIRNHHAPQIAPIAVIGFERETLMGVKRMQCIKDKFKYIYLLEYVHIYIYIYYYIYFNLCYNVNKNIHVSHEGRKFWMPCPIEWK